MIGRGWTWARVRQRVPRVLEEGGIAAILFKVLGETVYRRMIVMECSLDEPVDALRSRVDVEVDLLDMAAAGDYRRLRPETPDDEIRRRRDAGHWCAGARIEGRVVSVCWVAPRGGRVDYLDRDLPLGGGEAYLYEVFTEPAVRGRGISSQVLAFASRRARTTGCRRIVALVNPENRAAFPPLERNGYRRTGVIGYMTIGPWRRDFRRTRPRRAAGDAVAPGPEYRNGVADSVGAHPYLDPFLARQKRRAHVELIERWGGLPDRGIVLKTDLFEEGMGGEDAFLAELAGSGRTVVGMDISPTLAARARARDAGRRARHVAADARRLPFADRSIALVVSPSTLDHFADPSDMGKSLRELARVIEPGGRLIITLDNRQNVGDPLLRLAARLGAIPYYLGRSYRVGELRSELEAAGFRVEATTSILHNPRLFAAAAMAVARFVGSASLTRLTERTLSAAQRLEHTRLRYFTGSFVAAKAVPK